MPKKSRRPHFGNVLQPFVHHLFYFFLLLLIFFPCSGCIPTETSATLEKSSTVTFSAKQSARISVFLNLRKPSGPNLLLTFGSIELVAANGTVPLLPEPVALEAHQIGKTQKFISSSPVPAGRFTGLRFTLTAVRLKEDGKISPLQFQRDAVDIAFSEPLSIAKQESKCVFVSWDLEKSLTATGTFSPQLHVAPQSSVLIANLAYIACPWIDTVYYMRTDTNFIVGAIGVAGRPTYLAINRAANRLYVLASQEASIKIFDLDTNRQLDAMTIPMTRNPSFMALSPDGYSAYVIEEQANYVVRMDLRTNSLASRVRLGQKPDFLLCLPEHNRIAVSSSLSQQVILADPETLAVVDVIQVGNEPQGMVAGNDQLYVADSRSNTVTVYDLLSRQVKNRIAVGFAPRRMLVSGNRIYVANYGDSTLSILLPGQATVARVIPLGTAKPLEMAASKDYNWLYVGDENQRSLTIIDPTSNRVTGWVELGAEPLGLAIIE